VPTDNLIDKIFYL